MPRETNFEQEERERKIIQAVQKTLDKFNCKIERAGEQDNVVLFKIVEK